MAITATPLPGKFADTVTVTLSSDLPSLDKIRYTLDETDPRTYLSSVYSAPLVLPIGQIRIRATEIVEDDTSSAVQMFSYWVYDTAIDSDHDGIPDGVEKGEDPAHPVDTDADGTPDYLDADSDADGTPDSVEAGVDPLTPVDTDDDGAPDFQDTDSDDDGLLDSVERQDDFNSNGIPNYIDDAQVPQLIVEFTNLSGAAELHAGAPYTFSLEVRNGSGTLSIENENTFLTGIPRTAAGASGEPVALTAGQRVSYTIVAAGCVDGAVGALVFNTTDDSVSGVVVAQTVALTVRVPRLTVRFIGITENFEMVENIPYTFSVEVLTGSGTMVISNDDISIVGLNSTPEDAPITVAAGQTYTYTIMASVCRTTDSGAIYFRFTDGAFPDDEYDFAFNVSIVRFNAQYPLSGVRVTWTKNSEAEFYRIYRQQDCDVGESRLVTLPHDSTSLTVQWYLDRAGAVRSKYSVAGVDEDGVEGRRSELKHAPDIYASTCLVYGCVADVGMTAAENVMVGFRVKEFPAIYANTVILRATLTTRTDCRGYFELKVPQGALTIFALDDAGVRRDILIPYVRSISLNELLDLPQNSLLGDTHPPARPPRHEGPRGGTFSREDLTQPTDSTDIVLSSIAINDIRNITVSLNGSQQHAVFTKVNAITLRSTVGIIVAGTEITVFKFD